jgi:hypothetical protein
MSSRRKKTETPQFLSGWKEIANYLGKGVRTVQRYELELGLPVRRPAGKATGSVVATKGELDAWVKASPIRSSFRLTPRTDDPSQGTAIAIRNNLHEMNRLRDQMLTLRSDLRVSLELLQDALNSLQLRLDAGRQLDWQRNMAMLDRDQEGTHGEPPRQLSARKAS